MAILKTIPIHNIEGISNCINYVTDKGKTTVFTHDDGSKTMISYDNDGNLIETGGEMDSGVAKALSYAENIEKTAFTFDGDEDILISGFNCIVESAPYEFMHLRYMYEKGLREKGIDPASRIKGKKNGHGKHEGELVDKEAREAYHIIMSFSERDDLTPQLVHLIGKEFCEKAFPDTKAVVSTHMNTNHLHNHIVRSAYNMNSLTKYKDTMENLNNLRQILNEISLKYGLDILLDYGLENKIGNSYTEQLELKNGSSWKEIMKRDIKKATEMADSWKDFKDILTKAGYGITEKNKSVTYYFLNDENKRVRDNNLGTDFTRDFIKRIYGEYDFNFLNEEMKESMRSQERKIRYEASFIASGSKINDYKSASRKEYRGGLYLHVNRYTVTGRRRTDAELLFVCAIKLLKHFGNGTDKRIEEGFKDSPVNHTKEQKITTMQQSLALSHLLGIKDREHLIKLKNECGKTLGDMADELKSVEISMRSYSLLNEKADFLRELLNKAKEKGLDNIDLMLINKGNEDVSLNRASLFPMSKRMRRELFLALKDSGYRLLIKYDAVSFEEGRALINFLMGKSNEKPEILIRDEDYYKHIKMRQGDDDRKEQNDEKNKHFDISIKDLSDEDKSLMYRIRSLANELKSYGFGINDGDVIAGKAMELAKVFNSMKSEVRGLKSEYRNLLRLEHNMALAENKAYVQGNELDIKIVETENKDMSEEVKEIKDPDIKNTQGQVFSVDDAYFGLSD